VLGEEGKRRGSVRGKKKGTKTIEGQEKKRGLMRRETRPGRQEKVVKERAIFYLGVGKSVEKHSLDFYGSGGRKGILRSESRENECGIQ